MFERVRGYTMTNDVSVLSVSGGASMMMMTSYRLAFTSTIVLYFLPFSFYCGISSCNCIYALHEIPQNTLPHLLRLSFSTLHFCPHSLTLLVERETRENKLSDNTKMLHMYVLVPPTYPNRRGKTRYPAVHLSHTHAC